MKRTGRKMKDKLCAFLYILFYFKCLVGYKWGEVKDDDNPIASTPFNISLRRRGNGREDEK